MLNSVTTVNSKPGQRITNSKIDNKTNSNKISFGNEDGGWYESDALNKAKQIHYVKSRTTFYKLFPSLNPAPKTVFKDGSEHLVQEFQKDSKSRKFLEKLEGSYQKWYSKGWAITVKNSLKNR